ncbi:MAG TPA: hypothetical protein VIM87_18415 [Chitinophaga sp.]|uniref:hypothetical protein n=1 Tax=Chitinophaga sp. TaxID=1869181 RepID=UPI002F921AE6
MRKLIILVFAAVCSVYGCNLSPAGNYPYEERYKYKIAEEPLIDVLELLKENDSSLRVPGRYSFADGRVDSSDYWYHIYFYNRKRDEIILTRVRMSLDIGYTDFAFVAIKKRGYIGNWKYINKDFDSTENKARKQEFKTLILDRIHLPIGIKGPNKANCKCSYYSDYKIDRFLHDADSIYTLLARKYDKNIMIIGTRGLNVANLMFITNLNGKNKGFYYELMERKSHVYKGLKLDKLVKNLVRDSAFLHTAKYDPDIVDHDAGLFISFNYSKSQFVEICFSQLMGENSKRPLAVALRSYLSDFWMLSGD